MNNNGERAEILKQVGKRIKAVRAALNLNQEAYAKKLNISQPFLSFVEIGKRKPSFWLILSLLLYCHVNLRWLLTGEGEMFEAEHHEEEDLAQTMPAKFADLFPGVPPDPDLLEMIRDMEVPILRNALLEKYIFYRYRYKNFIDEHRNIMHGEEVKKEVTP
jgi:transcriptional regulator with XRE-family HTH domain